MREGRGAVRRRRLFNQGVRRSGRGRRSCDLFLQCPMASRSAFIYLFTTCCIGHCILVYFNQLYITTYLRQSVTKSITVNHL